MKAFRDYREFRRTVEHTKKTFAGEPHLLVVALANLRRIYLMERNRKQRIAYSHADKWAREFAI